jgi:hypothetical protein
MTDKNRFFPTSFALGCTLVLLALVLGGNGCGESATNGNSNGASSPASKSLASVTCGSATNEQVVNAIYKEIDNKYLTKHAWQFNVTAAGSNVTIVGWSAKRDEIMKIAGEAAKGCVIDGRDFTFARNDLNANFRASHECAPGYRPCGDICIANGVCNLTADDVFISSDTPSISNSNSNSNTKANVVSNSNSNRAPTANARP